MCAYTMSTIHSISSQAEKGSEHTVIEGARIGNGWDLGDVQRERGLKSRVVRQSTKALGRDRQHTIGGMVNGGQYIHGTDPLLPLVRRELSPFLSNLGILTRVIGRGTGSGGNYERAQEEETSEGGEEASGHLEDEGRGEPWGTDGLCLYAPSTCSDRI